MKKIIQFNVAEDITIKRETLSGILLDIKAFLADGTTVCTLADFNKVALDISIERAGKDPVTILNGYLEDILIGLYAQTTKFELNKKKLSDGYKVMIDLSPAVIVLQGEDVLRIKTKFQNTAFTALSAVTSSIGIETIPAFGFGSKVPQLRQYPIGKDEISIDKLLGDNVVKVTMVTDIATSYELSTEAKPTNIDILANGYEKSASESLVYAENIHYLSFNPETLVEDLVCYAGRPLNSVRIKSSLTKGALASAKIMVIGMINA